MFGGLGWSALWCAWIAGARPERAGAHGTKGWRAHQHVHGDLDVALDLVDACHIRILDACSTWQHKLLRKPLLITTSKRGYAPEEMGTSI
jgi:hypothetical protein